MLAHKIALRYLQAQGPDELRTEIFNTFDGIQEPMKNALMRLTPSIFPKSVVEQIEEVAIKIQEAQAEMTDSAELTTKSLVTHLKEVAKQLKPHVYQLRSFSYSPLSKLPERSLELVADLEAQKIQTVDEWGYWGEAFIRAIAFQEQLQRLAGSREVQSLIDNFGEDDELVKIIKTLGSEQKTKFLYGYWRTLRHGYFNDDAEDNLVEAIKKLDHILSKLTGPDRASLEISKRMLEMALRNLG